MLMLIHCRPPSPERISTPLSPTASTTPSGLTAPGCRRSPLLPAARHGGIDEMALLRECVEQTRRLGRERGGAAIRRRQRSWNLGELGQPAQAGTMRLRQRFE
jgi:hypothetical protein